MHSERQPSLSRRSFIAGSALAAASTGATTDAAAQEDGETVTIDMTDDLVFDPDETTVAPGTTVVWDNVGQIGHSVTAYEDDIPEEAAYFASGGFEEEQAARSGYPEGDIPGGERFEHTFEVEGEYGYFCVPHESAGMVASLTVGEQAAGGDGGDGGGGQAPFAPEMPGSAVTLGVAASVVMVSVIALSYVFIKYGGDYGTE